MGRLLRWLHWLEDALLVTLLLSLLGLAAYQVIARNFFDTGFVFGDALVRVLVFWITMVGAMIATRGDEHIRLDVLARLFGPRLRGLTARVVSLFACVLCALLAYYSYQFVLFEYEDQTIAFASVPAWVCEAVMPVAAASMALRYALRTVWQP